MILKKITVDNFRNIEHAELEFSKRTNIFYGNNAQGKTNLLEAIAIALGKSFRNIKKNDIIPFNSFNSRTCICLVYESEAIHGKQNEVLYELSGGETGVEQSELSVKINSIPLKKATDLYGEFKYVTFIPDNLSLIKGSPDTRRRYLDNIAVMQNKIHRKFQNEYRDVLKQRCEVGRTRQFYDSDMIAVWDDILIKQGINLIHGRLKYMSLIDKYAAEIYGKLSAGSSREGENAETQLREILGISYQSDVFGNISEDFCKADKNRLYEIYSDSLKRAGYQGQGQLQKIPGAHKDDILFTINGNNARSYGSQGQLRSIAISLKLAEAEIIRGFNRENPVVLLDEVLGELDENRRKFIMGQFVDSQVFITSCNNNDFEHISANHELTKIWSVENGVFTSRQ